MKGNILTYIEEELKENSETGFNFNLLLECDGYLVTIYWSLKSGYVVKAWKNGFLEEELRTWDISNVIVYLNYSYDEVIRA